MRNPVMLLFPFLLGAVIMAVNPCAAEDELVVPVSSDAEITVERFPAPGKYLVLWLAPEYGFRVAHRSMARMLATEHVEVWQSNIVESLFLSQGTNSVKQLDGKYVADLVEYAHKATGKKIVVAGDSYAAITALRGARQWQTRKHENPYLIGAILFSPYTYAYIPQLGLEPEFMPIVSSTNIPVMIYQAKSSGNLGQFTQLVEKLQQHRNPVYVRMVPQVMSLFYEVIPTIEMKENAKPLPRHIRNMIRVLEKHPVPVEPVPLASVKPPKSGIDITLGEFRGKIAPVPIKLKNIHGDTVTRNDYKGRVTLVNFWATWCTPCIQEIPMLNRLKIKMAGMPFELISINYAEDKKYILEFMRRVHVNFPVLLDKNGEFAKQWNVVSYPSTFVIGPDGKIRFGVNSAIEWDSPEIIEKIQSLIKYDAATGKKVGQ